MENGRPCLVSIAGVLVLSAVSVASAQQVTITMYVDGSANGQTLQLYVQLADATDLSQWGGLVYHYNYSSRAGVWGTTGSDYSALSDMGPHWLEVPAGEGSWLVDGDVDFTCSEVGPMWGAPEPQEVLGNAYNLHYSYSGPGEQGYVYTLDGSGVGKSCGFGTTTWHQQHEEGMTQDGLVFRIPGLATICLGVCKAGKVDGVYGPNGPAPQSSSCGL